MLYICSLPNPDAEGEAKELFTDNPTLIERFAKAEDRPGRGVYTCINPLKPGARSRCLETVAKLRQIYFDLDLQNIDLDREEAIRRLQQLPLRFSWAHDSGSGNLHLGIEIKDPPLPGAPEYDRTAAVWKRLVEKLAADPAPAHPAALIRQLGTHNTKNGQRGLCRELWNDGPPCNITELEALDELLIQPLLRRRKSKGNSRNTKRPADIIGDRQPFDREERLAELHYPGNIHDYELRGIASLISSGVMLDDAVDTTLEDVRAYLDAHPPEHPWDWDREQRRIARMAYSWVNKHPELAPMLPADVGIEYGRILHAKGTPWLYWDRERKAWWVKSKTPITEEAAPRTQSSGWQYYGMSTPQPMRWTIKGILIELGVTILSGQWGTFKTTVALSLALSAMTGLPFAGRFRVKKRGAVIYFAAEGNGGLDYRLQALAREAGIEDGQLPFARRGDCPPLKDKKSVTPIIALIDEAAAELKRLYGVDVAMIVFDTWAKTSGIRGKGEDDDSGITAAVIETLDAISAHAECVCLAVDHMGKDIERGTRGSSGKEAIEGLLATLGERNVAGPITNTRLVVRKVKDGRAGFEIPFAPREIAPERDEDGDPITAILIDWGEAQKCAAQKKTSTIEEQLWAALDKTIAAKGTPLDRRGGTVMAAPADAVREQFYA